ncbi:RibD family protein [candidate division WOR-3 bacterium]|nr:RibD family protein [candidate division WOR-3 bacterium]
MNITERLQTFLEVLPIKDDRAFATLCYAQSLDGSIAVTRGQPRRMSGQETRAVSHSLRAFHDAVIVGIGTILTDDPRLTVRHVKDEDPQPVIFDSALRFPANARMMKNRRKPLIFTNDCADINNKAVLEKMGARILRAKASQDNRIDIHYALRELKFMGMDRVLVEGGADIIKSFITEGVVDAYILFITPVIVDGHPIKTASPRNDKTHPYPGFVIAGSGQIGNDLVVWGTPGP